MDHEYLNRAAKAVRADYSGIFVPREINALATRYYGALDITVTIATRYYGALDITVTIAIASQLVHNSGGGKIGQIEYHSSIF